MPPRSRHFESISNRGTVQIIVIALFVLWQETVYARVVTLESDTSSLDSSLGKTGIGLTAA